jgi:molybdopterin-guanine dinucleotide biosynthesis protein A
MDVILMAGGRISGEYALAAGTEVKALAPLRGTPIIRRVAEVLRQTPGTGRLCVVGPDTVGKVVADLATWQPETDSAYGNFLAGVQHLGLSGADRVLLCGTDVAMLTPGAVQDLLDRTPPDADICMPVVHRNAFETRFPGGGWVYVPLADGRFTSGSQFIVCPQALLDNARLVQQLFDARKSQVRMASALGFGFLFKLLTRRLRVPDLEARASALTGCRCRAVLDCHPELALDIDNLAEWEYAKKLLE